MITAKEALKIRNESQKVIEEHLKYIEEQIKEAASQGALSLVLREDPYKSFMKQAYLGGEIHYANKAAEFIVKSLKEKGFIVGEYYKEKNFGADTGLSIAWNVLDV
ncbi:hypothetical protein [Pasteurella phage PHB01]|uniref:Uncharacterized protein n=1 Tax=Pasteurella phage PHB01 TaxID=2006930 RepID=A0A218M4F1_9CAUD|nr:hypothetical protein HOR83_gp11 [Pasteurella phage PHB01]ASD51025.1 hypothetical protein [Pasteurella phage PHB01]